MYPYISLGRGGGDSMITKRDLTVILLTLCLAAVLFIAFPTRSQTSHEYDPWADVSGPTIGEPDGNINMRDIQYEILHFNTFGTPVNRTDLLFPCPKFFYSNGEATSLLLGSEEGTTGWVTTKSTTIPSNTLTNGTLVIHWNRRALMANVDYQQYTCYMRITLNGTVEGYWQFNPPMLSVLEQDYEFKCTNHLAILIPNIDNSVDLLLNLDFRIDCTYAGDVNAFAEMNNNQFEVTG